MRSHQQAIPTINIKYHTLKEQVMCIGRKINTINNAVLPVALPNNRALLSFARNMLITLRQGDSFIPPAVVHLDGVEHVCLPL